MAYATRAWTFHFTPTSASWLNAVEGFFAKLTNRRLKQADPPYAVALCAEIITLDLASLHGHCNG